MSKMFWAAVAASIQDYSIGQYWSVLISSFRIARNWRGRRNFSGYRAILMATTEPLMQACYLLSNDVVQRV